jgi:hypothetical protein
MIDFNNDISEYWQALDIGQCSIANPAAPSSSESTTPSTP